MSLLAFLLLCICSSAAAEAVTVPLPSTVSAAPNAYEILKSYNFPIGLLPVGATGYDFDPNSGKFAVYFHGDCSFSIERSYQLRYRPTISGRISNNKLQDLKGVSVKVLFMWVNIVEVDREKFGKVPQTYLEIWFLPQTNYSLLKYHNGPVKCP